MIRICVFASGNGSNAQNFVEYFNSVEGIEIALIVSNKEDAYVLDRAKNLNVDSVYIPKIQFKDESFVIQLLQKYEIDYVVLAGFLLMIPEYLIKSFPRRIMNIHPALLPSYGGKGMYGDSVHKAVIENKEIESGITIHFVNELYDEGEIIFQAKCSVEEEDDYASLAAKIHKLEYTFFPQMVERVILDS